MKAESQIVVNEWLIDRNLCDFFVCGLIEAVSMLLCTCNHRDKHHIHACLKGTVGTRTCGILHHQCRLVSIRDNTRITSHEPLVKDCYHLQGYTFRRFAEQMQKALVSLLQGLGCKLPTRPSSSSWVKVPHVCNSGDTAEIFYGSFQGEWIF